MSKSLPCVIFLQTPAVACQSLSFLLQVRLHYVSWSVTATGDVMGAQCHDSCAMLAAKDPVHESMWPCTVCKQCKLTLEHEAKGTAFIVYQVVDTGSISIGCLVTAVLTAVKMRRNTIKAHRSRDLLRCLSLLCLELLSLSLLLCELLRCLSESLPLLLR